MLFAAPGLHIHINISLISACLIRHWHSHVGAASACLANSERLNFYDTSTFVCSLMLVLSRSSMDAILEPTFEIFLDITPKGELVNSQKKSGPSFEKLKPKENIGHIFSIGDSKRAATSCHISCCMLDNK